MGRLDPEKRFLVLFPGKKRDRYPTGTRSLLFFPRYSPGRIALMKAPMSLSHIASML